MQYQKPQPDDIITITTSRQSVVLGRGLVTNTYTNVRVIESAKWEKNTDVRIADDSATDACRIISLNVVSDLIVNGVKVTPIEISNPITKTVIVKGSKNKEYQVQIEDGIAVSCTCTGYKFRSNCRHLNDLQITVDL